MRISFVLLEIGWLHIAYGRQCPIVTGRLPQLGGRLFLEETNFLLHYLGTFDSYAGQQGGLPPTSDLEGM
jgi:hypothetical protein